MSCVFCQKENNGKINRNGLNGTICNECNKQLDNLSKFGTDEAKLAKEYFDKFEDYAKMGALKYKDAIIKSGAPEIKEQPNRLEHPSEQIADYTFQQPDYAKKYIVLQVTLKEGFVGSGSGNIWQLEDVINKQAEKGYRLHTFSTASANSTGLMGGDRIQATMVFEKI